MTVVLEARNVNDAYVKAWRYLKSEGIQEPTRNGPVIASPGPVITVYDCPEECVLFCPERDANPFFHAMEAVWMLGGFRDVDTIATYNKQMREYSDDGDTFWGAYGYRWRHWFGYDQLMLLTEHLMLNPHSRRAVLGMYDPAKDLPKLAQHSMKDIPCNTHAYFRVIGNMLDMTVCCRSNDAMWGAYGSNAVHFSFLLQWMAASCNLLPGRYYQVSNNLHWYTDKWPEEEPTEHNHYRSGLCDPDPIFEDPMDFDHEINLFFEDYFSEWRNPWINQTLCHMKTAWRAHKQGMRADALAYAGMIESPDWRRVCTEWLERRYAR